MRPRWLKVKAAISAGWPLKCREPFLSGFPTMSENRWSRTFAVGSRARCPSPFEVCAEREAGLGNLRTFSKSTPLTTVAIPIIMASVHMTDARVQGRLIFCLLPANLQILFLDQAPATSGKTGQTGFATPYRTMRVRPVAFLTSSISVPSRAFNLAFHEAFGSVSAVVSSVSASTDAPSASAPIGIESF